MRKALSIVLFTLVVAVGFSAYVTETPAGGTTSGGCPGTNGDSGLGQFIGGAQEVMVSEVGPSARRFDGNEDGCVCAVLNCHETGSGELKCRWKVLSDNTFIGYILGE